MNKEKKILTVIVVLIVLVVFFYKIGTIYYDRKVPNFYISTEIYVCPGVSKDSVYSMILHKSKVRSESSLKRVFRYIKNIKPGHYTISKKNSSLAVARMLVKGWQTPINLVVPNGLRLQSQIAEKLSKQMLFDSLSVISALRDSVLLSKLGFDKENVFSLFMPDTYQTYWTDSVSTILRKQKLAYDKFWTKENLHKADSLGLTQLQVSILASIVKGETNNVAEMPKIAGVYLTRLDKGIRLQADPTIAFCFNYTLNRILKIHTQVDSPYNTYLHGGLPPHPICVPTKATLNAVLNPDKEGYLFFCANPEMNGTHIFAKTYSEHLRNAKAFQRALIVYLANKKKKKENE